MVIKRRRIASLKTELLARSREAALSAVQIFNNPLIQFKSETFIVLIIIAWTYFLHAFYRGRKIEYRYYQMKNGRRKFDRTKRGAYKYWELERCLNDPQSPIDPVTANNLRFLIGLRHEIEHQMTLNLDAYLSGRYQACILNYNEYVKQLFGDQQGIDKYLTYSLQFIELSHQQAIGISVVEQVPPRLQAYIADFDNKLSPEEFNSPRYSYRLLFTRNVVGKLGQADKVIEFVAPDSELAKQLSKEYWVNKEVERKKYLPSQVVSIMKKEGFRLFSMHYHTELWKAENAKAAGKGYGVLVANTWYWYERWVSFVREHCQNNLALYGKIETPQA